MLKRTLNLFFLLTIFATLSLIVLPPDAAAQGRHDRDRDRNDRYDRDDRYDRNDRYERYRRRYQKREVSGFIARVEESSNRFRRDVDRDLDRSRLDGSRREDKINEDVKRFEDELDRLRRDFDRRDSWWESRNEVERAVEAARPVGVRLRNNRFSSNVYSQWRNLKRDINRLAAAYDLTQIR
jgi:hypothetical protein